MENWPNLDLEVERNLGICFGCGKNNPYGLKLKFEWDGKTASAVYIPSPKHQGWSGYLHGGVTACILDEAMGWASLYSGFHSVTAKLQVRYRQMMPVDKIYRVTCSITRQTKRLIETRAALTGQDGEIFVEGTSTQFIVKSASEAVK